MLFPYQIKYMLFQVRASTTTARANDERSTRIQEYSVLMKIITNHVGNSFVSNTLTRMLCAFYHIA